MKQEEIYRIEGSIFSREALLAHCHMMVHDCKHPDWYRKVFQFIELYLQPSAGPVLQRSSGTTGDAKEFELDRGAMEASAQKTLSFFNLKPGDRVLLCLPADYIAGKMMVVRALVGGLDLVLTEPSSRPLKDIAGDFRFVPMVPLQVIESLEAGDELDRSGTLLVGGGELSLALRAQLESSDTYTVYESFGMSESYTHFALKMINGPDAQVMFRLLDGVFINIDTRGCLVVDIPGISSGPVVTNDLVEISEDKARFRWLGRYDNVINTGGIKVIPELLEQRISTLLGVTCLLLSMPHEKLGQEMVLMLEWPESEAPVSHWKDVLIQHLASHEMPKQFFPVHEIPRNASFKPDRGVASKQINDL
jgi:o-succinylbenzoate---CoA ligase